MVTSRWRRRDHVAKRAKGLKTQLCWRAGFRWRNGKRRAADKGRKVRRKLRNFLFYTLGWLSFVVTCLQTKETKSVSAICKTIGMRACWYKQLPHWRSRRFCWGFGCSYKYSVDLHRYALRYSEQAKSTQNPGCLFTLHSCLPAWSPS